MPTSLNIGVTPESPWHAPFNASWLALNISLCCLNCPAKKHRPYTVNSDSKATFARKGRSLYNRISMYGALKSWTKLQ
eukprot:scaffold504919_cov20-Prasinocladus_malaysianus.AAC.1